MRILSITGTHPEQKIGGAEYQTYLITHGLQGRGHDCGFLATAAGNNATRYDGDLPIYNIPGFETVGNQQHSRYIAQIVEEFKPDLCYIRRFEDISFAGKVCQARSIPYVSISCHAMETSPFLVGYSLKQCAAYLLANQSYRHLQSFMSIRAADLHLCNLRNFEPMIQRWLPNKAIKTIYNSSPAPEDVPTEKAISGRVLWVNNLKQWKRPEAFIELSHRLPQYEFVMIGSMIGGRYGAGLKTKIENAPANFHYLGRKSVDEVNEQITNSDLLLYTSLPVEGFANSFLQAWYRKTPTVSLDFDLDGVPERENIGRCVRSLDEMTSVVDELMSNHADRQDMGHRAYTYAHEYHNIPKMIDQYDATFSKLVA